MFFFDLEKDLFSYSLLKKSVLTHLSLSLTIILITYFIANQIPTKHVTEQYYYNPLLYLYSHYCHKYNSNRVNEEYHQDSDGDLINIAVDDCNYYDFTEFVASSNIVTPKYLVHAKKINKKFLKFLLLLFLMLLFLFFMFVQLKWCFVSYHFIFYLLNS